MMKRYFYLGIILVLTSGCKSMKPASFGTTHLDFSDSPELYYVQNGVHGVICYTFSKNGSFKVVAYENAPYPLDKGKWKWNSENETIQLEGKKESTNSKLFKPYFMKDKKVLINLNHESTDLTDVKRIYNEYDDAGIIMGIPFQVDSSFLKNIIGIDLKDINSRFN